MDFWIGAAVVLATLLGPIFAVLVTRFIDEKRQRRSRQMEVFRALMTSRRADLSHEYVKALNSIEIEFGGVEPVESAQRELFRHLNLHSQPLDWNDQLRRLQTRLLYAMATYLGYKMEHLPNTVEGTHTITVGGKSVLVSLQKMRNLTAAGA